jgi:hypothetical protein
MLKLFILLSFIVVGCSKSPFSSQDDEAINVRISKESIQKQGDLNIILTIKAHELKN